MAFYLLTGARVFTEGSQMQVLIDHVHTEPMPPSSRTAQPIAKEIDRLVLDCLRKDPADRPGDAGVLLQRIRGANLASGWSNAHAQTWWQTRLPELSGPLGFHQQN